MTEAVKCRGRVKSFHVNEGYIAPDDGGEDVYVWHSVIRKNKGRPLEAGQRVSFLLCEGPKGRYAESVRPI